MSGSRVTAEKTKAFDGFLLKPLTVEGFKGCAGGWDGAGGERGTGTRGL